MEVAQVEPHTSLCVRPALGLLQGMQLKNRDVGVPAFQHVRQLPPQRRIALVHHLARVWEVGDLEQVEVPRAWGVEVSALVPGWPERGWRGMGQRVAGVNNPASRSRPPTFSALPKLQSVLPPSLPFNAHSKPAKTVGQGLLSSFYK